MRFDSLASSVLFAALAASSFAENVYLVPGLEAHSVNPTFVLAGGHFAADPNDPGAFFITGGVFEVHQVWHVGIDDQGQPTSTTLVADGSSDVNGDNLIEDHFGSPSLIPLADGRLIVADSATGSGGAFGSTLGEAVLLATDGNNNDNFLGIGEVTLFVNPAPYSAPNFTGGDGTIGPDGRIYLTTQDLFGAGEVLAFETNGTGLVQWATGLDRGQGIVFLPDGRAVIADTNTNFNAGRLLLADDADNSGTASGGEVIEAVTGLPAITHLGISGDGEIYVALQQPGISATIERIDLTTGARTLILSVSPTIGSFNNYIDCFSFDSSGDPFAPGADSQSLLVHDFANGLQLISYQTGFTSVDQWVLY